ncbi:MAG: hypothetical protein II557_11990 [Clostridia bacterium]|nr:hypothetical protein [Clostridia bacterium]MBR4184382.1 hypothetical protein [Clostridia bacterium]
MPIFRRNKPADDAEKNGNGETPEKTAQPADAPIPAPEEASPVRPIEPSESVPAPESPSAHVPPSRFHTPEGFDFNRYFLAERRMTLENVSFETQRPAVTSGQLRLTAKDTIVAQLLGSAGVKATFNRTLSFEPDGPFTVSVSFSVMLVFNPGTRGEIDWKTIDLAEEFKKNCPQLVQTMMTKSALLIAEITNANGTPILPMAGR